MVSSDCELSHINKNVIEHNFFEMFWFYIIRLKTFLIFPSVRDNQGGGAGGGRRF